jgi:hypothetical protein
MVIAVLALSVIGAFYPGNRGSVYSALLLLYMITAAVSGYVSSTLYVQLGGEKWASNAGSHPPSPFSAALSRRSLMWACLLALRSAYRLLIRCAVLYHLLFHQFCGVVPRYAALHSALHHSGADTCYGGGLQEVALHCRSAQFCW